MTPERRRFQPRQRPQGSRPEGNRPESARPHAPSSPRPPHSEQRREQSGQKPKFRPQFQNKPLSPKSDAPVDGVRRNSGARNARRGGKKPFVRTKETRHEFHRKADQLPPLAPNTMRIIPIGGCEEVGRNMTIFEYNEDIVILDMGIQFPEEDQPGIDYIVPNTKYLEGKEHRIRAVIFSHGHLDHIGAAPILLEKLGNPTIVARPLTLALIKHKVEDYKKGTAANLKTITVKNLNDVVRLGDFTTKFFQVEHSIMDSMGVIFETPEGTIIHPGDWTMERDEFGKTHLRYDQLAKLQTRPTLLMLESLGSTNTKRHGTYQEMYKNLHDILNAAPGRIIIATFSSQVERVKWVIEAAKQLGKKVALDGYSMKMNIEMAKELGYIKIPTGTLIDVNKTDDYPENNVVIVCTGAQGEENAVLSRIASGEHRTVRLRKNDTVIFSSSIIPGNERSIQRLKDVIYRQCDYVIHGDVMDVHVSGHATRQDILDMIDQTKPDYYIPVYANHYFLKEARNLAVKHGYRDDRIIVPDNGTLIEVSREKGVQVRAEKATSDYVFVDGLGISDSQHVVLRDRQVLAEDGMLVVIATVEAKTGKLIQNPDIISRGFVFLKDNKELIEAIRLKVKKMIADSNPASWADSNQVRNDIRDKIGQFVLTKTQKRPMILPVVIEV